MVTKETKDRIAMALWDAFMLWGTGLYIGGVVYYLEKYYDSQSGVNIFTLIIVSLFIFPFLSLLFYVNRVLKHKYGRSED